jgi:hypothetical protein
MADLVEVLTFLIEKGAPRTQRELAEAIFGKGTRPSRLQYELGVVVKRGLAVRRGDGSPTDPYKYFPAEKISYRPG